MSRALRKALQEIIDSDIESRRRAMEPFVRATFEVFLRYLYRYLGNEEDCEDLLEDVYADIWENPRHLRSVTSEKELLKTVYLYYMRNHLRKVYRQRNRYLPLPGDRFKLLIAPELSIVEMMSQAELKEIVRRLLAQLKPRERECIKLYYIKGMSYRAIANELKTTVGAVKMLEFRTILRLRKMLKNEISPG